MPYIWDMKQTNTAMNYKLFNRHEVFTQSDMNLIFELQNTAILSGEMTQYNYICGLFDGYLYNCILPIAETNEAFAELVTRINGSL